MMGSDDLRRLADRFETEFGLDPETARQYANSVGDTPEFDDDDRLVIRDMESGKIIDRLAIPVS